MTILSAVTQAECQRILERTNEWRIEAKAKGMKFGRKRSVNRKKLKELHQQGVRPSEIARQMNIGRAQMVYKIIVEIAAYSQQMAKCLPVVA